MPSNSLISSPPHTHKRIRTHNAENVNLVIFSRRRRSRHLLLLGSVKKWYSIVGKLYSLEQSYTLAEKLHEPHICTSFDVNQSYLVCSRATDQTGWSCESLFLVLCCLVSCVYTRTQTHQHTSKHRGTLTRLLAHSLARSLASHVMKTNKCWRKKIPIAFVLVSCYFVVN